MYTVQVLCTIRYKLFMKIENSFKGPYTLGE